LSVRLNIYPDKLSIPRNEMARRLAAAAVFYVVQHQSRLGKSNPGPLYLKSSKPGEYPRKRTGFLQKSVGYQPDDLQDIEKSMTVRLGYDANASYGPRLEIVMRRLGLVKTLDDLIPQLSAIIGTAVRRM